MDPVVVVQQPGRQTLRLVITDSLVLGRECEGLLLDDPQVSRRHLELRGAGGLVWCEDLGSTNGTFVDGERLTAPVELTDGRSVTLGDTVIVLAAPRATSDFDGRATTISAAPGSDPRATSIDQVADLVASAGWRPPARSGETVTIVFSDIESSTEAASALGDEAWYALLEHHNELFRAELARAGGREIKNQGDGFMVTFTSARAAVEFAVALQRRLSEVEAADPGSMVRVRIGMHTGEAIADASGDLFGQHVNKTARIANLADGGQILASGVVREIASGGTDVRFGEPVVVELKGLDAAHVVHEVLWRD